MSPERGRPPKGDTKKTVRFQLRLTEQKYEQLEKCAERLNISKSEVVERGIDLVNAETK